MFAWYFQGGYDYIVSPDRNGVLVGAPVNGLSVTYQPNGQVTTFIAKSPHYPGNLSAYQPDVDINPKVTCMGLCILGPQPATYTSCMSQEKNLG